MLGFLFGKKGKFKLKPKMKVELEIPVPDGVRSFFTQVKDVSQKRCIIITPKNGNKAVQINADDIIKCIAIIEDTLYEVNLKVVSASKEEFEAIISDNVKFFDTILTNVKEADKIEISEEVPIDFRAMRTAHLQGAATRKITRENVEIVTNLPVPEGTDLKVIFRIPETPLVETEGVSEKSTPLEEDSKKSKTRIVFSEKSQQSTMYEKITHYIIHHKRRKDRRAEMEEKGEIPKRETELKPPPGRTSGVKGR
jgi:hypothetical protein